MKRKFKLFATLASLCLSVALMAFGVYAATTSTYSVRSTVAFDAQVVGIWTGKVSGGAPNNNGGAASGIQDPGQEASGAATYKWEYNGSEATANPEWVLTNAVKFGVASAAEKTLTYEFTFTNNSAGNANVKVLNTDSAFKIFNIRASESADVAQLSVAVKEAVAAASSGTAAEAAVAKAKGEQATDIKEGVTSSTTAVGGQTVAPGQAYALVITVTLETFTRQVPDSINGLDIKLLATPSWTVNS